MNSTPATLTPDQPAAPESGTAVVVPSSDWLGWAFACSDDEEQWQGPCDTREQAIEEAWDYFGDEDSIAIAPCYKPRPDEEDEDEKWTFVVRGKRVIRRWLYRHGWKPSGWLGVGPLVKGSVAQPQKGAPVELAMCESSRLMLRPDQPYIFRVHSGCRECAKLAEPYLPNAVVSNTGANTET